MSRSRLSVQLASLFILLSLLPRISLAGTMPFPDVPPDRLYKEAIEYAKDNKLVQGYPDGLFRPDNYISRAEFLKIVLSAYLPDTALGGENCFSDVTNEWHAPFICTANQQSLIAGYGDGTFRPNQAVSLIEAAKMLVKAQGIHPLLPAPAWYKPFIDFLAERQAIPITIGSFNQSITRGELAEIMFRLRKNITNRPSQNFVSLNSNSPPPLTPPLSAPPSQPAASPITTPPSQSPIADNGLPPPSGSPPPELQPPPPPPPESSPLVSPPPPPPSLSSPPRPPSTGPEPWTVPGKYPFVAGSTPDYFANDPRAAAILAGQEVYDMNSYNIYCRTGDDAAKPFATTVSDTYGEKILNGLKQLGYLDNTTATDKGCLYQGTPGTYANSFAQLNLFKKKNGLPVNNLIDQATLRLLDEQLRAIAQRDETEASAFPCYEYLVPAPANDASKNHLAFLNQLAINAFPEPYRIQDKRDCFGGQAFWIADGGEDQGKVLCHTGYWPAYNDTCQVRPDRFYILSFDDFTIVQGTIHEYAHYLDRSLYAGTNKIDTTDFSAISYDLTDKIEKGAIYYRPRPRLPVIDPDHMPPPSDPTYNEVKQHFFSYAIGWYHIDHPGYYTTAEDFAVSLEMYILHGIVFRDYMKDKPPLQQKYVWLKNNVFGGKEFNTGDPNYRTYAPDLYFPTGGIVAAGGIGRLRPDYVWDYQVQPISQPIDPPATTPPLVCGDGACSHFEDKWRCAADCGSF